MKKHWLAISLASFLLNCQPGAQDGQDKQPTEQNPILRAVTTAYGGEVKYAKMQAEDKILNIEISKSPVIEKQMDLTGMFASHIAWLCFENLPGDAARPQGIAVTVKLSTGETPVFDYSISELETVKNAMPMLEKTVTLLKAADYEGILALHTPDRLARLNREDLVRDCSSLDANNGRVTDFQFQGFAFFAPSSGASELLHLAGLLKRERYDTPLSVIVDPAAEAAAGPVYQINFDY